MAQPSISLSAYLVLSETGDIGAKRDVKHESQNSRSARNRKQNPLSERSPLSARSNRSSKR
ncbi:hypothetical protein GmHk_01G000210 [Glycine max]|nr:hypothetical protein GmHk_01G000210 [Glycine max]